MEAHLPPLGGQPFEKHFYYENASTVLLASTDKHAKIYRVIRFTKHNQLLKYELESVSDCYDDVVRRVASLGRLQSAGAAFGIMGFIRFLKGFYIVLITKRCRVGRIGAHVIYEVRDTTVISLLKDQSVLNMLGRQDDEAKYVELFKSLNFASNFFYFSYTYDLTNTLQTNMVHAPEKENHHPHLHRHSHPPQQPGATGNKGAEGEKDSKPKTEEVELCEEEEPPVEEDAADLVHQETQPMPKEKEEESSEEQREGGCPTSEVPPTTEAEDEKEKGDVNHNQGEQEEGTAARREESAGTGTLKREETLSELHSIIQQHIRPTAADTHTGTGVGATIGAGPTVNEGQHKPQQQHQQHRHKPAAAIRSRYLWNEFLLDPMREHFPDVAKEVSLKTPPSSQHFMGSHQVCHHSHQTAAQQTASQSSGSEQNLSMAQTQNSTSLHNSSLGGHLCSSTHSDTAQFYSPSFCCAMSATFAISGYQMQDPLLPLVVHVIHGYVVQSHIQTPSRQISMVLIARKSKQFAGSRYLKRGVIDSGDVANHVEVEQILVDNASLCHTQSTGRLSSYVQVRGSVPVPWYHPPTRAPQPPIRLSHPDPTYRATKKHFNKLISEFGAPVVVINVLKQKEKKKKRRERILTEEYERAINTLNKVCRQQATHSATPSNTNGSPGEEIGTNGEKQQQQQLATTSSSVAADPECGECWKTPLIEYRAFDLRNNTGQAWNTVTSLGEFSVQRTGFFWCDCQEVHLQCGVTRTNCVDCIDRTNFAKTVIGVHVLGEQLKAIGVLEQATDLAELPCVQQLFFKMYLEVGDALAIQYGGSATVGVGGLVDRGRGWDRLMELQRLYNNVISDGEKQQAINVFLGLYRPCPIADPEDPHEYRIPQFIPRRGVSSLFSSHMDPRRVIDIDDLESDMCLHVKKISPLHSDEDDFHWWAPALDAFLKQFPDFDLKAHLLSLLDSSGVKQADSRDGGCECEECGRQAGECFCKPRYTIDTDGNTDRKDCPVTDHQGNRRTPSGAMEKVGRSLLFAPQPSSSGECRPEFPTEGTVHPAPVTTTTILTNWVKDHDTGGADGAAVEHQDGGLVGALIARHRLVSQQISIVDSDDDSDDVRSLKKVSIYHRTHFPTPQSSASPVRQQSSSSGGFSTVSPPPSPSAFASGGGPLGNAFPPPGSPSTATNPSLVLSAGSPLTASSAGYTMGNSVGGLYAEYDGGSIRKYVEPDPVWSSGRQLPLEYADEDRDETLKYPPRPTFGARGGEEMEFDLRHYRKKLLRETPYFAQKIRFRSEGFDFDPKYNGKDNAIFLSCLSVLPAPAEWSIDDLWRAMDLCAVPQRLQRRVREREELGVRSILMMTATKGSSVFRGDWPLLRNFLNLVHLHEQRLSASLRDLAQRDQFVDFSLDGDDDGQENTLGRGNDDEGLAEIVELVGRYSELPATSATVQSIVRAWIALMLSEKEGLPFADRVRFVEGESSQNSVPISTMVPHAVNGGQLLDWVLCSADKLYLKLRHIESEYERAVRAREYLSCLLQGGVLHYVSPPTIMKGLVDPHHLTVIQTNEHAMYRLYLADERTVLNAGSASGFDCNLLRQPAALAESLASIAIQFFEEELVQRATRGVALAELSALSDLLQGVDLSVMTDIESRVSFWINVFNALHIQSWFHALTQSAMDFHVAERVYKFTVGDFVLSLCDIKHGILRGNKHPPHALLPRFVAGDPRLSLVIDYPEEMKNEGIERKVLLALMDIYLTPQGTLESESGQSSVGKMADSDVPVGFTSRLWDSSGGHFGASASRGLDAGPSAEEGEAEAEAGGRADPHAEPAEEDEDDEEFEDVKLTATKPASLLQWILGGRQASKEPPHLCVPMVPNQLRDSLDSIESTFLGPLQTGDTSIDPIVLRRYHNLQGLPEFGRSREEVIRHLHRWAAKLSGREFRLGSPAAAGSPRRSKRPPGQAFSAAAL